MNYVHSEAISACLLLSYRRPSDLPSACRHMLDGVLTWGGVSEKKNLENKALFARERQVDLMLLI